MRMLMSEAPLRLSMGGGGTDLASFYETEGGDWTSAAISLYVNYTVKIRKSKGYVIKYSTETDRVDRIDEIGHDITRESLKFLEADKWLRGGLETNIMSDVPSQSGLGVSGAITVSFLQILHAIKGDGVSRKELAEEAYHVEHTLCKSEATGKQDQYIAAFGGITYFEVNRAGYVEIHELLPEIAPRHIIELNENLVLYGAGIYRKKTADQTLREQGLASTDRKKGEKLSKVDYLKKTREIGLLQKEAMLKGRIREFGELLDDHWEVKKLYSDHTENPKIDGIYKEAKKAGALGGKIIGAGTEGGYWLFYIEAAKKAKLRNIMAKHGLEEFRWNFVNDGAMICYCK